MKTNIIAEIGWNHMGDMSLMNEMLQEARKSGATTAKFQYWDPKTLKEGDWDEDGRREIYNKAFLDDEKINEIYNSTIKNKLKFLISVFSTSGAKKIASLGIKHIKIPSHEVANKKLISFCANNFEKVFFSAGAGTTVEIKEANEILATGSAEYTLMHCVSSYPCPIERSNLLRINWLKTLHSNVGLSDHTQSTLTPALAVAFGVNEIEKHFTSDNDLPGRDNKFALNPVSFLEMTTLIRNAEKAFIDHGLELQDIERDTYNNYRGRWDPSDYDV